MSPVGTTAVLMENLKTEKVVGVLGNTLTASVARMHTLQYAHAVIFSAAEPCPVLTVLAVREQRSKATVQPSTQPCNSQCNGQQGSVMA